MSVELILNKEKEISDLENRIIELKKELEILKSEKSPKKSIIDMTGDDKVKLFASLFRGRDDVYAIRYNTKDNKSGYSVACNNEWKQGVCINHKCKTCQYRENKPLTLDVYEKHLKGKTIGIYPMTEEEGCYFLAIDFDKNKYMDDVLAFSKVCDDYNIPRYIERSRSGNGAHVWLFFEDKVKAVTARKLGSLLLSKAMEVRDNIKVDSFDRMFPNQDIMPKGGFGNLIALPFQLDKKGYGNTIFIDKYFYPIKDQLQYLKNIRKINFFELENYIHILSNDTIDVSQEDLNIKEEVENKNKNKFDFPKEVNVILEDMVYIDKNNLSGGVKHAFKRLASFANPEFFKKQRLRMSVYNIPMVIDCSKDDDKYIKLPRGTYEYLKTMCDNNDVKINLLDRRNKGNQIDVKFNGTLRDNQEQALNELTNYDTGILEAPTGFGKTVIATALIAKKKVNTLVIVEKLTLLRQWQSSLKKFLNLDEVGIIGGGKNIITNIVDVASIKSLWNKGNINQLVKNYGLVIMDECHHTSAYTYENALNAVNAKCIYGLSATPTKENGHTPIIKMQCGEIRHKIDFKEFNKELGLPMKVIIRNNELKFVNLLIKDYTLNEINDLIAKDVIRTEKIIKDIEKVFLDKKNVLVLTNRLDHLEYMEDKLSKITDNLFVYRGGLGKKVLKKYEAKKEEINNNHGNKIVLATGSSIGEGFDDDTLEVLFLTMPISGMTRVIQFTGRLHRKNKGKKEIVVYDYVDINFKETRNMLLRRKRTYMKLGYEIIESYIFSS
jgi:hypothetical protein